MSAHITPLSVHTGCFSALPPSTRFIPSIHFSPSTIISTSLSSELWWQSTYSPLMQYSLGSEPLSPPVSDITLTSSWHHHHHLFLIRRKPRRKPGRPSSRWERRWFWKSSVLYLYFYWTKKKQHTIKLSVNMFKTERQIQ